MGIIKFRAWDKTLQRMVYIENVSDFEWFGCGDRTGGPDRSLTELNLMQYVGLDDKNDKEIYERIKTY